MCDLLCAFGRMQTLYIAGGFTHSLPPPPPPSTLSFPLVITNQVPVFILRVKTLKHPNRQIWQHCRPGRGSNASQWGERRSGGGAVVGCLRMCVRVCDCWLVVLSVNTHTWCVSSSQTDRWEERSHFGLLPPISAGWTIGGFCFSLFLSFLFFFLALSSASLNPLRKASHAEHT